MSTTPLFLSHWEASTPVCVGVDCVKDLKNYNILGIRFLYNCFHKQHKGAILNHEAGMNFEIQVSAFLNALAFNVSSDKPVLVICTEKSICNWHYHLVNHGGYDVTVLSLLNVDFLESADHRVILSIVDNTAALKKIKHIEFFCVVVDEFDKLVAKSIVKQIKGQFNIGLTHRNFMNQPNQKLFWTMFNWSNPGVLGKFADFCTKKKSEDNEHLSNLRYPYNNWWQRLTWKYCDSFTPPSDEELKEYRSKLKEWSKNHNIFGTYFPKCVNTRKRRNIKTECSNSETKLSKKAQIGKTDRSDLTVKNKTDLKEEIMETDDQINPLESILHEDDINNAASSNDTVVIYDFKDSPVDDTDENHILTSIISGKSTQKTSELKSTEPQSSLISESMSDKEDDIVMSIIGRESSKPSSTTRRNNLLSLLYGND